MTDSLDTAGEVPATDDARIERLDENLDRREGDGPHREPGAGAAPAGRARAAAKDVLTVVGIYLLLGLVSGLLWWLLVDPATFTKVSDGGSMGELELGKRFNGDGWYAVIGAVAGLSSGVAITWWRSRDFLLTTALLVVGAGVAAAVMAVTGHLLGPGDTDVALAAVKEGAMVPVQLEVTAKASYLVWPIAALIGSLVVLWSPSRDSGD